MSSTCGNGNLYERLVAVRGHLHLSQSEMAEKIGISLRAYQNYERGEREAPVILVRAFYERFNVSPIWLLTGQGNMLEGNGSNERLDTGLLQQVIEAVENFSANLPRSISIDHKSQLIALLYEKSRLLSEVTGEKLNPTKLQSILKLVA